MSELSNSEVLVTGGAGFIGSWLVENLLYNGANVVCVDNLSTGTHKNIKHLKKFDTFMFEVADVSNKDLIDEWASFKFDYIIHFASQASPLAFQYNGVEIIDANVLGSKNMLELARMTDAVYMFASSSEVYGYTTKDNIPTKEKYWGNVNSVGVRGCYDESKRLGEAYAMAYKRKYGIDVRLPRIFNTYGERMPKDGRVIPTFCNNLINNQPLPIYGTGEQTRAFLYVADLIEGLIALLQTPTLNGIPINLGQTKETKVSELVNILTKISGLTPSVKNLDALPDDPMARLPDITLAQEVLTWMPKTPLEEGLKATYHWFHKTKDLYNTSTLFLRSAVV